MFRAPLAEDVALDPRAQPPQVGDSEIAPGTWPFYDEDEIAAAMQVLESGRVNQWTGDRVRRFEELCARRFGAPHAVAVFNGTVALELALRALNIGAGDEVVVAARSFVASASCVFTVGATPVFADIDPLSLTITAETIAAVMTSRTRAIIPVHLAGWPADMPAIMALARQHDVLVIEDCAQAHGAAICGRPVGSFGDAAAFSFCQDKILSTGGEGGLVLFQDRAPYERAWSYKDHGKHFSLQAGVPPGHQFRYVHQGPGSNWRMTEFQAAIGIRQLDKLGAWIKARHRNAAHWREYLADLREISFPEPAAEIEHAYYRLCGQLVPDRIGNEPAAAIHGRILQALYAMGVPVTAGGCPEIYREGVFAHLQGGQPSCRLPGAVAAGERVLAFPVHPTLSANTIARYAQRVRAVVQPLAKTA